MSPGAGVCVCVCVRCSWSGQLPIHTHQPPFHSSHLQATCNLAVNLIIQIAKYFMLLKHNWKERYYLFTWQIFTPASGGLLGLVHLRHVLNYWPIICLNSHLHRTGVPLINVTKMPSLRYGAEREREKKCICGKRGWGKGGRYGKIWLNKLWWKTKQGLGWEHLPC